MKRRHFLRTGVFGGTLVLGNQIAAGPPACAAGGVKSRFFEGSLLGGPLGEFALQIGVAAARTRGTATPPGSTGTLDVVPMSGMFLGQQLTLAIYSAAEAGDPVQIGTLAGTLQGKSLKGTYSLDEGGKGTFATRLVVGNKKAMKKLSGAWEGSVNFLPGYAPGWSGVTTVKPNGNWELTDVKNPVGDPVNVRFAGIYVVPPAERSASASGPTPILAMLLPRTSKGIRGLGICDCDCCVPADKDRDGVPDTRDDSDLDGIPDDQDKDWDNDGKNDDVDPDDDNDGVPDDQDKYPYSDSILEANRRASEAAISAIIRGTASPSGNGIYNLGVPPFGPDGRPIIASGKKR